MDTTTDPELEAAKEAIAWERRINAQREALPIGVLHALEDPTLVTEALSIVRAVHALQPRLAERIQAVYDACPDADWDLAGEIIDATPAREADHIMLLVGSRLTGELGPDYDGPVTWDDLVARAQTPS